MEETHTLALETLQLNKQAIIFAASRANAEKTAGEINASRADSASKLPNLGRPW